MHKNHKYFLFFVFFLMAACGEDPPVSTGELQLISVSVGPDRLSLTEQNMGLSFDKPVVIRFSQALDTSTVDQNISLLDADESSVPVQVSFLDENKSISLQPLQDLEQNSSYSVQVGNSLLGKDGETFPGFLLHFITGSVPLEVLMLSIDDESEKNGIRLTNISLRPEIEIKFSEPVLVTQAESFIGLTLGSLSFNFQTTQLGDSALLLTVNEDLPHLRKIRFKISYLLGAELNKDFSGFEQEFFTQLDSSNKFPLLSDDELLDLVQAETFKYFWDFAHPVSGLNRERNTSNDNVTSGGSGFGVMAIPLGIERGYITRTEGLARLNTIVDFLAEADRFHGAWSHWLSGSTGKVNPFSADDDGGDLVETSYMAMGLLTARQYLNELSQEESLLIDKINDLLDSIEWDWYTQDENSLTWHWSPNVGFKKNMKIRGWNEALITYVMAASSANHGISREVYEQGWGSGSNMLNGKSFYNIVLPLGRDYGGPLFFEQYSFIGLDPRNLNDQYADYWEQAVNHTLINRQYCIQNPLAYVGYSSDCWGLTASDGNLGYSAHAPNNDRGVITPTAALSSFPFTPQESMDALHFFYYKLGDRLWGPYGFYDAFNITANWYGTSNIAIDQGPILLMIENYRSGLLWDLFMSAPEIQSSLSLLGFTF